MRAVMRVVLACLLAACGGGWNMAEGTPPDLADLVSRTMARAEAALPAVSSCLEGVIVTHAWELDDRAEYRTHTSTVVLRVPATAPELEFSLAHELAHHLETNCEGHDAVRAEFLQVQGHPEGHPWFQGDSWETTPSEQFATAVATVVTGRSDPSRDVTVTGEALEVVRRWTGAAPAR